MRKVEQSPLVRYAREAGVKITTGDALGIGFSFALEKHRHALVATVLVLSLLCYAIVDFAMNEEVYAVDPPFVLFGVAGAIAVLASMLWLVSAGVPRAASKLFSKRPRACFAASGRLSRNVYSPARR